MLYRNDGKSGNGTLLKRSGQARGSTALPFPEAVAVRGRELYPPGLRLALEKLDQLIGLNRIKDLIHETTAFYCVQARRTQMGLKANPAVIHMIFKGNPGTGKTSVARLLGPIFREMGALKEGQLVEVERADLVGEYIGHTAQKTRQLVTKARGGILFVDEAYSLGRGGDKDFGKEAIDLLVKAMEDMKDDLVLILAGYRREMETFLRINPRLMSRFPLHLTFLDYTADELLRIGQQMFEERQYHLGPSAREYLERWIRSMSDADGAVGVEGNARFMRNLVESTVRRQSLRLVKSGALTREDFMAITRRDVEEGIRYCLSERQAR